jgi:flagellar protein FlbT
MPLRIDIKAGEKFLLNNTYMHLTRSAGIIIESKATFLRDRDLIAKSQATTAAKKVYYICQQIYLFEREAAEEMGLFSSACAEVSARMPALAPFIEEIQSCISTGDLYRALKLARRLVEVEDSISVMADKTLIDKASGYQIGDGSQS